ncbi:MAG: glycosyltransferase family 2 protein [Opitutaceae bacterium]|nr:glycosyltransferase family 2 protein [Opitutaceae bacterium]
MVSVVILTLNEERDLPRCLASLHDCDDIVVLDSGSTDRTSEIAREAQARVIVNPFKNFAVQRNFAQEHIAFRHPWVMHLDADEMMTPELWAECLAVAQENDGAVDGYWIAPKMMFHGRWIPHCTDYPAYQARLVRAPRFRFIEVGHGQREAPDMRLRPLRANYLHDLSSGGDEDWLAKHRRYAQAEAREQRQDLAAGGFSELFAKDALRRRRALKRLSFKLPCRPWLRFAYQYVLRGGFLDGAPGWRYCRLLMRYEQFIDEAKRSFNRAAS